MRIYLISGEASGDKYGAQLIRAIEALNPSVQIRAWGGEQISATTATLAKHIRELSFMGFGEVVKNLSTIRSHFVFCKKDVLAFKPDRIVLIDYPGFNLRIAKWAKKQGIEIHYFIAPKVWAWNRNRAKSMAKFIDRLYCIFPFEERFFSDFGIDAIYVGNPSINSISNFNFADNFRLNIAPSEASLIALLPGSRKQEIKRNLPIFLQFAKLHEEAVFCIAKAPNIPSEFYEDFMEEYQLANIRILENQYYDIIKNADFALVCSGTATLETALLNTPQIVCYRSSTLNYLLAKNLIRIPYISLVNILLDRPAIPELIQHDMNTKRLQQEMDKIKSTTAQATLVAELRSTLHAIDYQNLAQDILKKT